MRVGIAGDWHTDVDWAIHTLKELFEAGVTTVFHVGDFSFDCTPRGLYFLETVEVFLAAHGMRIFVTMGNHDNYAQVNAEWVESDGEGFLVNPAYPSIMVSPRSHRFTVAGRSFLSSGGANSINRSSLTPHVDWWAEEQIGLGDVYRSVEGGYADVMLTHECPAGVPLFKDTGSGGWSVEQLAYAQQSRDAMRQIVDAVKPGVLFHGHYHLFLDTVSVLNDGVVDYEQRTVGLEMNGRAGNAVVLDLVSMEWSVLV